MKLSPVLEQLVKAFSALPGIGPKSAERLTFACLTRLKTQAGEL